VPNEEIIRYLQTKRDRMGHLMYTDDPGGDGAEGGGIRA
jgi:hypothetical protein